MIVAVCGLGGTVSPLVRSTSTSVMNGRSWYIADFSIGSAPICEKIAPPSRLTEIALRVVAYNRSGTEGSTAASG